MTKRTLFWKVVLAALLAMAVSTATGSYTINAQGAIAQGDPTGAATGTAKDVTVKDAKNPSLGEVMETVGHNKIAINFVWTLLAGFLVIVHAGRFRDGRDRLYQSEERRSYDEHELHDLPDRHARVLDLRIRAADGRRRRRRVLGGTAPLNHEVTVNLFGHPFGLFGLKGFFLSGDTYDVGVFALFLFQMVFMDTAGTIPTGAMAERWKFSAFIVFGFFMSMLVYPIFANWVWGAGWLSQLGAQFRARPRARRLCRFFGRPHGWRRRRTGWGHRPRTAHREVHEVGRIGRDTGP
jgi:Amt family ammonium transporter